MFYVWQFERPTPLIHYLGAVALPIVVILACLFPLAPWWLRMAFVYTLLGILMTLLTVIAVRYLLFGVVWTLLGYSLWIFPNMMSEEVRHCYSMPECPPRLVASLLIGCLVVRAEQAAGVVCTKGQGSLSGINCKACFAYAGWSV